MALMAKHGANENGYFTEAMEGTPFVHLKGSPPRDL